MSDEDRGSSVPRAASITGCAWPPGRTIRVPEGIASRAPAPAAGAAGVGSAHRPVAGSPRGPAPGLRPGRLAPGPRASRDRLGRGYGLGRRRLCGMPGLAPGRRSARRPRRGLPAGLPRRLAGAGECARLRRGGKSSAAGGRPRRRPWNAAWRAAVPCGGSGGSPSGATATAGAPAGRRARLPRSRCRQPAERSLGATEVARRARPRREDRPRARSAAAGACVGAASRAVGAAGLARLGFGPQRRQGDRVQVLRRWRLGSPLPASPRGRKGPPG